jgi:hypothetical protein
METKYQVQLKKNQHKGIELKKKSYMKKKTIPLFSFKSCHKIFFFSVGRVPWDQPR